jgi:hypothetical protein
LRRSPGVWLAGRRRPARRPATRAARRRRRSPARRPPRAAGRRAARRSARPGSRRPRPWRRCRGRPAACRSSPSWRSPRSRRC